MQPERWSIQTNQQIIEKSPEEVKMSTSGLKTICLDSHALPWAIVVIPIDF